MYIYGHEVNNPPVYPMSPRLNTMLRRVSRRVAIAATALIICQCVYFNVFYNAKASYDTAYSAHRKLLKNNPDSVITALPADIQSNYDHAIEKASKVFDEYPKKVKWHDDALFLMGRANYYKGEYEKSLRNFTQLQEDFPASPFIPEAALYKGRAYLQLGSLDRAEQTFSFVLENYPHVNDNEEVSLLLVEISLRREGKAMALDLLEKTVAQVKSTEKKIDLIIKIARLSMDLKRYDKAIALLKSCPRNNKYSDKMFLIDCTLIGCYEVKDSLSAAMNLTNKMLHNKIYGSHVPEILLKKASIYAKMGKFDDAIAMYSSIAEVYAPAPAATASATADGKTMPAVTTPAAPTKTPAASTAPPITAFSASASASGQASVGTALFELGMIYQVHKGDFVKAKEYFTRAISTAQDTAVRASATLRVKSIDSLFAFQALKDTTDTLKGAGKRNALDFKIGELFWLEMNLPDSALVHFKRLAITGDSLRPKALYSASYIYLSALRDTAEADSFYSVLLKDYPSNEYAKKAQQERGEKITVHTRLDSAQDAFSSAESLYCDVNDPEAAAAAFLNAYYAFPHCEPGYKALYASAWINDEALNNNKTAYRLYRMLCDSFPKSETCLNSVKPKLKAVSDSLAARRSRRKGSGSIKAPSSAKAKTAIAPAQQASPASAESDSLSEIKDHGIERKPQGLENMRGEDPRMRAMMQAERLRRRVEEVQGKAEMSEKSAKGSIVEDTVSSTGKTDGAPKIEAAKTVPQLSPPSPAETKSPEISNVNKATETPKAEIKEEDVDSEEVIGQMPAKK
jgi:tetratricopeptide (TPR) repeat protein